jgi:hypothetical protein
VLCIGVPQAPACERDTGDGEGCRHVRLVHVVHVFSGGVSQLLASPYQRRWQMCFNGMPMQGQGLVKQAAVAAGSSQAAHMWPVLQGPATAGSATGQLQCLWHTGPRIWPHHSQTQTRLLLAKRAGAAAVCWFGRQSATQTVCQPCAVLLLAPASGGTGNPVVQDRFGISWMQTTTYSTA